MDVILEHREVMRYLFKALFSKKIHRIDNKDFSVSYQKCSNFKNKDVQHIQLSRYSPRFFTLNNVIVRPTKNYEQSRQKLGTFLENKVHTQKIKVFKKFPF